MLEKTASGYFFFFYDLVKMTIMAVHIGKYFELTKIT